MFIYIISSGNICQINKNLWGDNMKKSTNRNNEMMYGMCIGVGVGTALGMVFNHTILGIAIGLGVGMFVGALISNKNDDDIE